MEPIGEGICGGGSLTPPVSAGSGGQSGVQSGVQSGLNAGLQYGHQAGARSGALPREVLAIGVSTGGPTALLRLLPLLPADFSVPIVIVQHMPPVFTGQLAARLNSECALEVLEASEGLMLRPGRAILAPGDFHMLLKRVGTSVTVALNQRERENSCRPSVDVLFRSVGEVFGGHSIGLILTGMGQDGLRGAGDLKRRGSHIVVQDRESSVVWGMPGAVAQAGLADSVLSLDGIAPELMRQVKLR